MCGERVLVPQPELEPVCSHLLGWDLLGWVLLHLGAAGISLLRGGALL